MVKKKLVMKRRKVKIKEKKKIKQLIQSQNKVQ
jgi:hypothetical protein